ncbi:unnamed protein product, partial [Iphiclides podalirius]
MDHKKKLRRATRSQFTKIAGQLNQAEGNDRETYLKLLAEVYAKLQSLDREIEDLMGECSEAELEKELDEVMAYHKRFISIEAIEVNKCSILKENIRKYKLPPLETKKFDGQVKNWLPFWGQFQKIDEDKSLDDSDKFQYLIQAMTPGTETLMVKIVNGDKEVTVRALIDNGAQRSYLKRDVAQKLGLKSSEITDFWSLELLGIKDPVGNKNRVQTEAEAVILFEETITVNSEGRYEVALPFKVGHEELQSNRGLAEKRLVSSTKLLKSEGKEEKT